MLSVILLACLIADPEQCRDFKIQVDFKMPAKYCSFAEPVRERNRYEGMRMEDIMREANPNAWKVV
jgi:hypothetical protein